MHWFSGSPHSLLITIVTRCSAYFLVVFMLFILSGWIMRNMFENIWSSNKTKSEIYNENYCREQILRRILYSLMKIGSCRCTANVIHVSVRNIFSCCCLCSFIMPELTSGIQCPFSRCCSKLYCTHNNVFVVEIVHIVVGAFKHQWNWFFIK